MGTDTIHSGRVDRLVYLAMFGALVVMWATLAAFTLFERNIILERAQSQLGLTVATLADFNELAQQASGDISRRGKTGRSAAIWRALLLYPTASIWVDHDGLVSAGQPPAGDLGAQLVIDDVRTSFAVHAALPRADVLADWRHSSWLRAAGLMAISLGFVLLVRFLVRAMNALREHDALLVVVSQSAAILLGARSEDAIPEVLGLVGPTIRVARIVLCEISANGGRVMAKIRHEWHLPGGVPPIDDPIWKNVDLSRDPPHALAAALSGEPVPFDAGDFPELGGVIDQAHMRSSLQIPIMVEARLWGMLTFIDSVNDRRQWSWAESDTLKTLAGLVGAALARARFVKDLADANTIVQNSPTILYRLKGEPPFSLIYVSENISKFGRDPKSLIDAASWTHGLVDPADEPQVTAGLARMLDPRAQSATSEIRLHTADGSARWVENRCTPVRANDGHLIEIEGMFIDVTERKTAEDKIALLARTDGLTGIANRNTFIEHLHRAFAAAGRGEDPFAILYIDLDHFKDVNDTLGHPVGDELLREVAERLKRSTRDSDVIARLGGDEFAVLQTNIRDPASAGVLAGLLQKTLGAPYLIHGSRINSITASIGICPYSAGGAGPDAMLAQADLALYRSKDEGRNQYRFHTDDLDQEVLARVTVTDELRHALEHDELELLYQPQVDVLSEKMLGMEAQIRWNHPRRGFLEGKAFLPSAEKAGLMTQVGHWVLDGVCRQLRLWQLSGLSPPVIAFGLSLAQLKDAHELVRDVTATTAKYGIAPSCLEFEVTEASLAHVTLTHNDVVVRLRCLGAQVAIDDFGTEYSSFDYLRVYGVSHVKIAQSFITGAHHDPKGAAVVRAIIDIAREFHIGVIAEGVDTAEQRALVASTGSNVRAQGNLWSASVDAGRATELLRRDRASAARATAYATEACKLLAFDAQ